MTEEGWLESDSELFAEFGKVFIPGREQIAAVILDHVPAEHRETFSAVEIGCGSGWLGEAMLDGFPESKLLALDGSPRMLRAAGELLARHGNRAELRPFQLENPEWISWIGHPVRCFVSSLVIHHLDGPGKRALFGSLRDKLEPGGALLYADLVEPRSERGRTHMARAWDEEVRSRSVEFADGEQAHRSFVDRAWNWFEHPDPADKPSGTMEQLRWLEEEGFEGVDVPWARAGHAVFCAYKPA